MGKSTGGSPAKRLLLGVVAAACLVGVVTAVSSAAGPISTDWSAPVWVGPIVNSASTDNGPAFSGDGLSLYFYSGRTGGVGSDDIWVSHRASLAAAWGPP